MRRFSCPEAEWRGCLPAWTTLQLWKSPDDDVFLDRKLSMLYFITCTYFKSPSHIIDYWIELSWLFKGLRQYSISIASALAWERRDNVWQMFMAPTQSFRIHLSGAPWSRKGSLHRAVSGKSISGAATITQAHRTLRAGRPTVCTDLAAFSSRGLDLCTYIIVHLRSLHSNAFMHREEREREREIYRHYIDAVMVFLPS